ncbi:MAG: NusA-like transcription termination signal-binding factor [Candidatus Nezhaarchaeota archaeon]|nr:NusA-like transcription termination signal-binding factor [Candidatus Nezhaarchaeota archaeon]MCX8141739.1 NusA-like transcription termination signal-binding factor [Candidatus Nezhaarchaeota archaeon]MDW8050483.1 NusA-like transcription termination signal-binding factor [Nitrososphaerota archaeon]
MPSIRLSDEEMRYITLFESITGATAKDCIIDNDGNRIIFLIKKGEMGIAIGKNGINIKRATKLIGKPVEVVEAADTPEELIKNALFPAKVHAIRIARDASGKLVAHVAVDPKEKGLAIGKEGSKIQRARILAKRYFDIEAVILR